MNTTWELIPSDKYIRSSGTALQTGGNNYVSIAKTNLPNIQLQVNSFSLTRGSMDIVGVDNPYGIEQHDSRGVVNGAFGKSSTIKAPWAAGHGQNSNVPVIDFKASRNWTGSTSSASPYTQSLGSGTALNIQPSYITLKFWKRLT